MGTAAPGGCVHVIGAGLAGLSAAVSLLDRGRRVVLSEAGPAAGGRCRSYFDRELGVSIDNGNHLVLKANHATIDYLVTIGARDTLVGPRCALFPFLDLSSGEGWTLAPNRGRFPWWIFCRGRRVGGTRVRDYLRLARLLRAGPDSRVSEVLGEGILARRLLEPLAIAALNTRPEAASARLFAHVVAETLGRGGAACAALLPRAGLSETFVDPALAWLAARGAMVTFGHRVAGLEIARDRVVGIASAGGARADVQPGEAVVLAVPAPVAASLLPGISVPRAFESILNVHYRIHADPGAAGFTAVLGGLAEWVFVKREVVSVTVSAANRVIERPAAALAREIWPEVCAVLGRNEAMPAVRVLKERRATFAATPAEERRRPPTRTELANLALAGDWTATGLPGTIEGAIRSGKRAAELLCQ